MDILALAQGSSHRSGDGVPAWPGITPQARQVCTRLCMGKVTNADSPSLQPSYMYCMGRIKIMHGHTLLSMPSASTRL